MEQQLFDVKQGLLRLDDRRTFDDSCLRDIGISLTAMANTGPGATGYVVVGVADTEKDAQRVQDLDHGKMFSYRGFRIVGIEREAKQRGQDLNSYWGWLVQKLTTLPGIDPSIAKLLGTSARLVSYHGLAVGLLRVEASSEPKMYDGVLYERRGSSTVVVTPQDYMSIYRRFA